jgi:hypothetical protein
VPSQSRSSSLMSSSSRIRRPEELPVLSHVDRFGEAVLAVVSQDGSDGVSGGPHLFFLVSHHVLYV